MTTKVGLHVKYCLIIKVGESEEALPVNDRETEQMNQLSVE